MYRHLAPFLNYKTFQYSLLYYYIMIFFWVTEELDTKHLKRRVYEWENPLLLLHCVPCFATEILHVDFYVMWDFKVIVVFLQPP